MLNWIYQIMEKKKKADLKGATDVDTLNLATKLDLACFNTEVEQKN